jgi:hypothetical protein
VSTNRFDRNKREETEFEKAAPKFQQDFIPELRDRILGEYRWRMILLALALVCLIFWGYWCWRADQHARMDYPNLDKSFLAMQGCTCNYVFVGLAGLLCLVWANSPLGLHFLRNIPGLSIGLTVYWAVVMLYLLYRLLAQAMGWPAPEIAKLLLQPLWIVPAGQAIAEIREVEREVAGA